MADKNNKFNGEKQKRLTELIRKATTQKRKFSIRKLRIWSHLLKKSLMENFLFCAVQLLIHQISGITKRYHQRFFEKQGLFNRYLSCKMEEVFFYPLNFLPFQCFVPLVTSQKQQDDRCLCSSQTNHCPWCCLLSEVLT